MAARHTIPLLYRLISQTAKTATHGVAMQGILLADISGTLSLAGEEPRCRCSEICNTLHNAPPYGAIETDTNLYYSFEREILNVRGGAMCSVLP